MPCQAKARLDPVVLALVIVVVIIYDTLTEYISYTVPN